MYIYINIYVAPSQYTEVFLKQAVLQRKYIIILTPKRFIHSYGLVWIKKTISLIITIMKCKSKAFEFIKKYKPNKRIEVSLNRLALWCIDVKFMFFE